MPQNTDNNEQEIAMRKDKEWSEIDGELCMVTDFQPLMGSLVKDGIVISLETSMPYASISLKCAKTVNGLTGFVTHKMDFAHLWAAVKERKVDKGEEILIYWSTKHYKYRIYQGLANSLLSLLGGNPMPKLIVMICPKGTYKSCPDGFKWPPKEKALVLVYGLMSIKWWIPDVIE